MKSDYTDVAIIGGGPGGYSAALYCARSGYSVLVLEKLSPGGQMATTGQVDNYPGFDEGIDGFELGEKMQRGAERFGVKTEFDEVVSVDLASSPKQITTTSGVINAGTVIIATGASPRLLGLPEENALRGRGVAYCATCDGQMYKNKTVIVAGGGNSAAAGCPVPLQDMQQGISGPPPRQPEGIQDLSGAFGKKRRGILMEQQDYRNPS